MASVDPDLRSGEALEAEIARLHVSIDRLSDVVAGLQDESRRQAARMESLADKQAADFRALSTMLHDNFVKLVDRQDAAFKSFGDRLDKLVERQDSHFRWLAGLVVASALSIGIAVVRLH